MQYLLFFAIVAAFYTLVIQIQWRNLWLKDRKYWSAFEKAEFKKQKYIKLIMLTATLIFFVLGYLNFVYVYIGISLVLTGKKYLGSNVTQLTWMSMSKKWNKLIYTIAIVSGIASIAVGILFSIK